MLMNILHLLRDLRMMELETGLSQDEAFDLVEI